MKMITVFNLIVLALSGALPSGNSAAQAGPIWVQRETFLMGTVLRAQAAADDRAAGFEALEAAFFEVRRLEGVLSSWTTDSGIGQINSAAVGEAVPMSRELTALLTEAMGWSRITEGAFDPAVGALVDAWELRGVGRLPTHEELATALRASGRERFPMDDRDGTVLRTTPGAWLDTGGFGKGAALRAAERILRSRGIDAAMLDFGGQVLAYGAPPTGEATWEIAVAHPAERQTAAVMVRIRSGSVSTSAQSERYVEVDGERYGHVLDPRTGWPMAAWGSVTVVAADPLVADVLSTALFVMGAEEGRQWAAERDEGVLFLEVRDGSVVASWNQAFETYRVNHQATSET